MTQKSQHTFTAETGRVLELLTHSIYSNKEIFLRELLSNAADAIDKARLKALTDTSFLGDDTEFAIRIDINTEAQTLRITDNGIGMTLDELHAHLGTIAKSGTKEFIEKLQKAKEGGEHNLIGQFGVGFYSAFMVAKSVEVLSKSALDTKAHRWTSDGSSMYSVEEIEKETRGTDIILHFSEGNTELLQDWKIRELIKKYSNYLPVPIMMKESLSEKTEEDKTGENQTKTEMQWKQVNETKAIWKKAKSEVTQDEYTALYQSLSMDFQAPLAHIHTSIEGKVSYKALLYIPKEKNMFRDVRDPSQDYGPKLYVQNVLILENAKELLPVWLRFISGVIETNDLPLNISREMLQNNSTLETIKKSLIKKILQELKRMRDTDSDAYSVFFQNFGSILKEGVYYETDLKEEIIEVCLWDHLQSDTKITFDAYLEAQSGETKTLYYASGKSKSEILVSPYLAQFQKTGTDVLFFTDPIDEWIIGVLPSYKDIELKSMSASGIVLEEMTQEQKQQEEEQAKTYKDILELMKNTIGTEALEKVELNPHLGDALGALKTPENALNPQMEKMMRAMGQAVPKTKRILEINPNTALTQAMKEEFSRDVKSQKLLDLIRYTYMQAVLLEGGELEDIGEFVRLTNTFAGKYAQA